MTNTIVTIMNQNTVKVLVRECAGYMVGKEIQRILNNLKKDGIEINNTITLAAVLTNRDKHEDVFTLINDFQSIKANETTTIINDSIYEAPYKWFVELKNETEATIYGIQNGTIEIYKV